MARSNAKNEAIESFRGFSPGLFTFIDDLAAHQTRDWFLENKPAYEREMRAPLAAFVESLAVAFAAHDIPLTGSAKSSLFRINRDVRFSKDKSPYKTNASAVLSRDGTKAAKGVFYFHVGGTKREAMMAVGFYGPEPSDLAALRTAMVTNPKGWARVTESASVSMEDALARMPKGFETHAAEPIGSALKLRSLVAVRHVEIERVYGPGLIDDAVAFAKAGLPLLEFGWKALRS